MDIPNKGLVAIVGESGSGKSTIASLIMNTNSVTHGAIKLNGINIENISLDDIYNKISLVSTNSYIFNGSIMDNLLMGKYDATKSEINDALKKARLHDFVQSLRDGLNTNVGEGGSSLSGGQKQRLALARAILGNREMIVFDEATSNIDIESEEAIWESIYELSKDKTIVEEVAGDKKVEGNSIKFKDVEFSYPGRQEKILDDISININKGDKIALIGESGIGKSTFIKLIMRFWDVNSGRIDIDGINIKDIPTKSLRASQTLVSQETYLFNESIEDNIKIGNLNASREEVIEAAKKASIHDFIEKLPKGYDTKAGELGGMLSSGEKQRIGLARAFISNGDVLILDEPTSNLDTLNESEILRSIKENCEEKTIILISHRKSTTSVCNKVYKLEKKKLVLN